MSAERAVALVHRLALQNVRAVAAQAEVAAGEEHDCLEAVLADDTLFPLLLLLQQGEEAGVERRTRRLAAAALLRGRRLQRPARAGARQEAL